MRGLINIDKPGGMTSSDVVTRARRILGTRAVGHMGTLDPQGTGVLVLGVGKATRLFDHFLTKDKVYRAEFKFGYETDTLDGDGTVVSETGVLPATGEIAAALDGLTGRYGQIPPAYSAKSVGGVRAYKLARGGQDVELKPAEVEVYDLRLLSQTSENTYLFEIHCSAGTYIRSICRDLAYALGSLATMTSIRRTRSGPFAVEDAVTLETLAELGERALIPVEQAVKLPRFDLPETFRKQLDNGVKFEVEAPEGEFLLYAGWELYGIGRLDERGRLTIKTYLRD